MHATQNTAHVEIKLRCRLWTTQLTKTPYYQLSLKRNHSRIHTHTYVIHTQNTLTTIYTRDRMHSFIPTEYYFPKQFSGKEMMKWRTKHNQLWANDSILHAVILNVSTKHTVTCTSKEHAATSISVTIVKNNIWTIILIVGTNHTHDDMHHQTTCKYQYNVLNNCEEQQLQTFTTDH